VTILSRAIRAKARQLFVIYCALLNFISSVRSH
jgi:hypothetical protein